MVNWGIVTDEVMDDPAAALDQAAAWGIKAVELRGVGGGRRIPDLAPGQLRRLRQAVSAAGMSITALSPGTWKCSLQAEDAGLQQQRYQDTLDLAETLAVGRIITFGVRRDPADRPDDYPRVREILGNMAVLAQQRGIILCVENERDWWVDTLPAMTRLLADLAPAGLRLNWDAANFADTGGRDLPGATRILLPWMANCHLKDFSMENGLRRWRVLGRGEVGWPALLPILLAGGQQMPLTIETHCEPKLAASYENIRWLRQYEEAKTHGQ